DIDAIRRYQSDIGGLRLAIATEAIAAQRKGKRGEAGVMRRIGETIGTGRQQARQQAGPEQVAGFAVRVLEPEDDLGDSAIRGREGEARTGLGPEGGGGRKPP